MKETRRIFCNYDAHLSIAIAASEQGYRVDGGGGGGGRAFV